VTSIRAKRSVLSSVRLTVRESEGYKPDRTPAELCLDANECAFPIPDELRLEIDAALQGVDLRRYPDPEALELKQAIQHRYGLDPAGVVVGNGSDELISILVTAFGERPAKVLVPTPTFAMYQIIANCHGLLPLSIPLTDEFDLDGDALLKVVEEESPKLVFLASPNNPTGRCLNREVIARLLEESEAVVVVDEAYADFAGVTHTDWLGRYDNLVILRTLSKVGLAGLRVGFLAANPLLAFQLDKVRLPYNVGILPQTAAAIALRRWELLQPQIDQVVTERRRVYAALQGLAGVETCPSDANFLLLHTERAREVHRGLLERGIRVKRLGGPQLDGCLRITIGQPAENDRLLATLTEVLADLPANG
jgi:histidinol-phosphate aminotransferase